ncbi:MAG: NAD kinase [Prevotella sp.]|nr:NAD kinase [Prevotella sp.]MDD5896561.1 NAD kinase [Prevotellaceae bacterium]
MASRTLKFAIFGNTYQVKKSAFINNIIATLKESGAEVSIDSEFYRFLVEGGRLSMPIDHVFHDGDFDADFVVSMGGDGTFLKAASRVGSKEIPIIGVNMGRLGFLADVHPEEFHNCVSALYQGQYAIEDRTVIKVTADGSDIIGSDCALNDVAILKRDNASMITIHASINGEHLTTYQADGLVVSTPTGSTAYSLSVGGPIIVPGTHIFSLTAVAPHSLSMRPIVLSDESVITLRVECRSHHFLVALDGRSEKFSEGTTITLQKAPYRIKIVKRQHSTYFSTLREKLMWGADTRGK